MRKCDQLNSKRSATRRRKGVWQRKLNQEEKNTGLRKVKKLIARVSDPMTSRFDRPHYVREADKLAKEHGYYIAW